MEAEELRIGNWYMSVKFRVPVICDLSDLYNLCANADGATSHPPIDQMFEPILLTEEWLEKFGFVSEICINGRRCFRSKIFGAWFVDINDKDGSFFLCIDGWEGSKFPYVISRDFKYVHHLQNLFFALTGEELTISDK